MLFPQRGRWAVWLLSSQSLWAVGCESAAPRTSPTEVSLGKLATAYGKFVTAHKGKGPASEAELRAFLAKAAPKADLDALFRSERDGLSYVVLYSASARPGDVIAYEAEGRNGRRFVALATTEVREMDESAFRKAISNK